jgi:hypothetical protein
MARKNKAPKYIEPTEQEQYDAAQWKGEHEEESSDCDACRQVLGDTNVKILGLESRLRRHEQLARACLSLRITDDHTLSMAEASVMFALRKVITNYDEIMGLETILPESVVFL